MTSSSLSVSTETDVARQCPAGEAATRQDRPQPAGSASPRDLRDRAFLGLLATQFLGATNDNVFRWLAIGIGKDLVAPHQESLILSLGLALFVLPYLLLAAPAGYLADRFSKRRVIVGCKVAEVVIMCLALAAIHLQSAVLLFGVLFLMGSQSALFSPAKLGSIPEMLPPEKISAANGVMGLVTVIATVLGAGLGNYLYAWTAPLGSQRFGLLVLVLIGLAAIGWWTSLHIVRLPAADPCRRFPINAVQQSWRDLRLLGSSRALLRVALGIALFWALGSLVQLNIDQFGAEGGVAQEQIVPLLLALVFGVAAGSVLAGYWSNGRVELGLVPLGAAGMTLGALMLYTADGTLIDGANHWTEPFYTAGFWLFLLGIGAGLFDVPLEAYLQQRSPPHARGAVLAASNFLTFASMLAAAGVYYLLRAPNAQGVPWLSARGIFCAAGLLSLVVLVYVVWLLPGATARMIAWLLTRTVYRVRLHGCENIPDHGAALLVANHISWVDGLLVLVHSPRPVRMLAYAPYVEIRGLRWLTRLAGVIPIHPGRPKQLRQALDEARRALERGELVCIFPEGGISRDGRLGAFKPGLLTLVDGLDVPIVPLYLRGLWGSIFSYSGGKVLFKRPRRWPYRVDLHAGTALRGVAQIEEVRQAVVELQQSAEQSQPSAPGDTAMPVDTMLTMCRQNCRRFKVADTSGMQLTGGSLLVRTLVLRRLLAREVLAEDEKYVGLLLPPSIGAMLANAALPLLGRVAVNLNYTVSSEILNRCNAACGIRHVLTSRRVMQKLDLRVDAELVYLEDLIPKVKWTDKLIAACEGLLMPLSWLKRRLGVDRIDPDDTLTVIFTSGSTGDPKGVVLSHRNVGSNVQAIPRLVTLHDDDVLLGTLPFFHSFGYTCTLWTTLMLPPAAVYHFSPLDAREIGKLCRKYGVSILMSTPTFLRSYIKRCDAEDLKTLEIVIAGAEKLTPDVADAFEKKFGVRPVEGYGTTELSPLVSVNVPPHRNTGLYPLGEKPGSVGRPIPGVEARIVDPETFQPLPAGGEGMLLIRGPNVMRGYLNRPQETAAVIRDGWYITGDMARLDEDGFIFITGRLSRFSKIGGEMVPHLAVEEALMRLVGDGDELKVAVSAVPDPRKGERLVVLHVPLDKTPQQLSRALQEMGLPNLFIPSPDSYYEVPEIPVLGTGKLDLRALKQRALELAGSHQVEG